MAGTRDQLNAFLDYPERPVPSAGSGPLAGLTLGVKDIFDVAGYPTGGGNPQMLAEAEPARTTAPAVQVLLDAGARFVGKTQTDELAFSLMGQNAHYPHPVNPAARGRVTGGSSSGSAAAVVGGLADIALGSDTGGSIRAPASFCGLIGLRISHGAISLDGAMPLAPSLDTFGWFARNAEIYQRVGEALLPPGSPFVPRRLIQWEVLDGLVLGEEEATAYRRACEQVAAHLAETANRSDAPFDIDALYRAFRLIQGHEAWAIHGPFLSKQDRGLGPGVKERFEFGRTVSTETYVEEGKEREALRAALADRLSDDGILVLPTVPGAAPRADLGFDALQAYRERALRLLCLSGLSGFPQITLPLASAEGAPFGISLIGPKGSDRALIALGRKILEDRDGC